MNIQNLSHWEKSKGDPFFWFNNEKKKRKGPLIFWQNDEKFKFQNSKKQEVVICSYIPWYFSIFDAQILNKMRVILTSRTFLPKWGL